MSDRGGLEVLVRRLQQEEPPLSAVVHTAGTASYGPLRELSEEQLALELRAKVVGAWHLHDLLSAYSLDAFVLYSSIAGLWGSGQQAGYSAANSALEALGEHRRALGLPATVVAWGPWAGQGLVDQAQELIGADAQLAKRGLNPMAPSRAVEALAAVVGGNRVTVGVVDVDWGRFAPSFASMRARPLLQGVAEATQAVHSGSTTEDALDGERVRLTGLATEERRTEMLLLVQREVALVLELRDADAIHPDEPLDTLGLDSLMAVQLRDRFSQLTGAKLSATLAFDYPTPRALGDHFTELLDGGDVATEPPPPRDTSDLASLIPTLTDAELDHYGLRAGLQRLVDDLEQTRHAETRPADEGVPDTAADVESMDTDDLLSLLQQKYGKDGDA